MPLFFNNIDRQPKDAIFGILEAYKTDSASNKVNLSVGAYRTGAGRPKVLNSVRLAEVYIAEANYNKEYLSQDGSRAFQHAAQKLLFGDDNPLLTSGRLCTIQSISGTGALRLSFTALRRFLPDAHVAIPNPTWGNHKQILNDLIFIYSTYAYYDHHTRGLSFDKLIADLVVLKEGTIVLFHMCAHNPTGVDPTQKQWRKIIATITAHKLFPVFDAAYQGFASGDLDKDAFAVRHFASTGYEGIVCQSFAKNFGLYGERIGAAHFICRDKPQAKIVRSHLKRIVRTMYSNPPLHGSRIIERIVNDKSLRAEWYKECKHMANRMHKMRAKLHQGFVERNTPGNWDHVIKQIGMFCFTGLTPPQVDMLRHKYHIYMLKNGRISVSGLTNANIDYVVTAIDDVINITMKNVSKL